MQETDVRAHVAAMRTLVAEMRELGVTKARIGRYELELGPVPSAPVHLTEEERAAKRVMNDENAAARRHRLMFAATSIQPPLPVKKA